MHEGRLASWNTIFVITEILVCLFGITFNGIVIFTICRNIHRRISAPTYLILSIAVSDFLSCAIAIPLSIARHFHKEWPFGMAGCKAHAFLIFLLALVSITHLAAISAGKYLTITRSLTRDSYFDKTKVVLIILASWIYSFGFSVAPLVGWSRYGLEGTNVTCSVQWESSVPSDQAYFGVVVVTCYFLPLAMITFCYYKIHQVSKQIAVNTSQGSRFAMTARQALLKKHRKSSMYFLAIIAAFLIPWSPYAIVSFLLVLGQKVNPLATSTCSVFAKISFFLNPMLYAICKVKFRRRFVLSVPLAKKNRVVRPAVLPSVSRTMAL
ncbi:melanopsin-like [Oculina patagonica]